MMVIETQTVTLTIEKGELKFSAGHFTIFSATERERMHGHNYYLALVYQAKLAEPGISFDYRILKRYLRQRCAELDGYFLLPTQSPYLQLNANPESLPARSAAPASRQEAVSPANYIEAVFNGQPLWFLQDDVRLLPIPNITLESLSQWFLNDLITQEQLIESCGIVSITLQIFNGEGNSGISNWAV